MKRKIILFIFYIIGVNMQGQNNTFSYYSGSDEDGFSQRVKLTLNSDNSFSYKFVDDEVCYETISISFGKWEQKGDNIRLNVADSIKPKIRFEKQTLKKNILTIFFNRANEKVLFKKDEYYYDSGELEFKAGRQLFFYDGENKEIEISYNNSGILEIPKTKEIRRIEMYLPNNNHKDNYLEINIPEHTGQIFIENLSRYVITDFGRYSFVLNKNKIIMKYPWGTYKLKNKN